MKILTNKQYNKAIRTREEELRSYYIEKITNLEEELKTAEDLSKILDKFSSISINGITFAESKGVWDIKVPDNVLVYVDDILGGKVIKPEGTKCIVINEKGEVTQGLTKESEDKGFNYKLVRK